MWPGDEHGGRLTGQSFPLTFDFGLGGLDGDGDTLAPDSMSRMGKKGETVRDDWLREDFLRTSK